MQLIERPQTSLTRIRKTLKTFVTSFQFLGCNLQNVQFDIFHIADGSDIMGSANYAAVRPRERREGKVNTQICFS